MKVRIYKPSKSAMQSGRAKTNKWLLEYERPSACRPESLMGWTSSSDTLNQVKLRFDSCDEAVSYAQKKGWDYNVAVEQKRIIKPRNYSDKFKYRPKSDDL